MTAKATKKRIKAYSINPWPSSAGHASRSFTSFQGGYFYDPQESQLNQQRVLATSRQHPLLIIKFLFFAGEPAAQHQVARGFDFVQPADRGVVGSFFKQLGVAARFRGNFDQCVDVCV